MIKICDIPVPVHEEQCSLCVSADDPLVVEGESVRSVYVEGVEDDPFRHNGDSFYPPPSVFARLDTAGVMFLLVEHRRGILRVQLERKPIKLSEKEWEELLDELGDIAISLRDRHLFNPLSSQRTKQGHRGKGKEDEESRLLRLFEELRIHIPELLERPLRQLHYQTGVVPVQQVPLAPQTILTRKFQPEQQTVFGVAVQETEAPIDYAWLRQVVQNLVWAVKKFERTREDIREEGMSCGRNNTQPLSRWVAIGGQLQDWLNHPTLEKASSLRVEQPTWVLSRSVAGAEIIRALEESPLAWCTANAAALGEKVQFPIQEHAHLYELWVLMSLVDILCNTFSFRFSDPTLRWVEDYVTINDQGRWVFTRPIDLVCECISVDGHTPIILYAKLEHEAILPAWTLSGILTPDITLTLTGGEKGRERKTIHILDAKYSSISSVRHALHTAYTKYLLHLRERPTGAYVVLPGPQAAMQSLMNDLDARYRTSSNFTRECSALAVQTGSDRPSSHGFAWGSFSARPQDGRWGLRQFVTLVLQYHRTELRHVCASCGHILGFGDLRVLPSGQTRSISVSEPQRKLAAHRDEPLQQGGMISTDLLEYRCACQEPAYRWARHACPHGHVLMKFGKLTPHKQQEDEDRNVVCGVCGHYKKQGGGKNRLWKSREYQTTLAKE